MQQNRVLPAGHQEDHAEHQVLHVHVAVPVVRVVEASDFADQQADRPVYHAYWIAAVAAPTDPDDWDAFAVVAVVVVAGSVRVVLVAASAELVAEASAVHEEDHAEHDRVVVASDGSDWQAARIRLVLVVT